MRIIYAVRKKFIPFLYFSFVSFLFFGASVGFVKEGIWVGSARFIFLIFLIIFAITPLFHELQGCDQYRKLVLCRILERFSRLYGHKRHAWWLEYDKKGESKK